MDTINNKNNSSSLMQSYTQKNNSNVSPINNSDYQNHISGKPVEDAEIMDFTDDVLDAQSAAEFLSSGAIAISDSFHGFIADSSKLLENANDWLVNDALPVIEDISSTVSNVLKRTYATDRKSSCRERV